MEGTMTFYVEAYRKTNTAEKALRHVGDFETISEAIAAAKRTIVDALLREYTNGMSGAELFAKFQAYGEMPCIFRSDDKTLSGLGFNALVYAKESGADLCGK
jgi:hypothetical protein